MARVLVGRPRLGMRLRIKRRKLHQGQGRCPEDTLRRESMGRGRGTKYLNENLAPLERYLRRQVGRPWDKVYSEIAERLRPTSAVQQHVRDHLADFVAVHTWLEGDEMMGQDRWGGSVTVTRPGYGPSFFVDPRTGLLRERKRQARRRHHTHEPDQELRWDGPWRQLRRIGGVWYSFRLAPLRDLAIDRVWARDCLFGKNLEELLRTPGHDAALLEAYERPGVFAVEKRQLSKQELKRLDRLPWGRKRVDR